jgi:uncharacterized membrane protein YraQ (UPF0718 family)
MSGAVRRIKENWIVGVVGAAYAVSVLLSVPKTGRAATVGVATFVELLPTLITVFVFVGLFQVWVSDEFVVKHLGEGSGAKGLALGAALGTVIHGPLIGVFPLLKSLLAKGARVGVVVAIVSTWAIKLPMIPLEVRLFGWRFAALREGLLLASAFVMAAVMELALGDQWKPPDDVALTMPAGGRTIDA